MACTNACLSLELQTRPRFRPVSLSLSMGKWFKFFLNYEDSKSVPNFILAISVNQYWHFVKFSIKNVSKQTLALCCLLAAETGSWFILNYLSFERESEISQRKPKSFKRPVLN